MTIEAGSHKKRAGPGLPFSCSTRAPYGSCSGIMRRQAVRLDSDGLIDAAACPTADTPIRAVPCQDFDYISSVVCGMSKHGSSRERFQLASVSLPHGTIGTIGTRYIRSDKSPGAAWAGNLMGPVISGSTGRAVCPEQEQKR